MTRSRPGARREQGEYDPQQRHTAALIQRDHPAWLILYGPWSRLFWGYSAPRGALLYTRLSREELGGRFLGLMAYLASKD